MDEAVEVVAIGNALVDLVVEVDDALISRHGLPHGDMLLTDAARSSAIMTDVGPIGLVSYGGTACNTAGALTAFGVKARFIGKIAADPLGDMFKRELDDVGVTFATTPLPAGPVATASCLILVTPDGQRTGVTHLGACGELDVCDLPESVIAAAPLTFQEAYSLDRGPSAAALRRAGEIARTAGRMLAFTLSDPSCVARHGAEIVDYLARFKVDILFANESEAEALAGTSDFAAAVTMLRDLVPTIAVTRGARGSLVVAGGSEFDVAAPRVAVVDTTGAGDHYAAGFIAGWLAGRSPAEAGTMGARAAAAVIGHFGAKPRGNSSPQADASPARALPSS